MPSPAFDEFSLPTVKTNDFREGILTRAGPPLIQLQHDEIRGVKKKGFGGEFWGGLGFLHTTSRYSREAPAALHKPMSAEGQMEHPLEGHREMGTFGIHH